MFFSVSVFFVFVFFVSVFFVFVFFVFFLSFSRMRDSCFFFFCFFCFFVIPAKAGIHTHSDKPLDSRLRGNDKEKEWIPACAGMTRGKPQPRHPEIGIGIEIDFQVGL